LAFLLHQADILLPHLFLPSLLLFLSFNLLSLFELGLLDSLSFVCPSLGNCCLLSRNFVSLPLFLDLRLTLIILILNVMSFADLGHVNLQTRIDDLVQSFPNQILRLGTSFDGHYFFDPSLRILDCLVHTDVLLEHIFNQPFVDFLLSYD